MCPLTNYQLFVDDSGTREYDPDRVYHRTGGKSRHFVYGGVLVEQRAASLLAASLQQLKRLTFRATDVEVKTNWLRMPDERRTRYSGRPVPQTGSSWRRVATVDATNSR